MLLHQICLWLKCCLCTLHYRRNQIYSWCVHAFKLVSQCFCVTLKPFWTHLACSPRPQPAQLPFPGNSYAEVIMFLCQRLNAWEMRGLLWSVTINGSEKREADVRQERMVENGNKETALFLCMYIWLDRTLAIAGMKNCEGMMERIKKKSSLSLDQLWSWGIKADQPSKCYLELRHGLEPLFKRE